MFRASKARAWCFIVELVELPLGERTITPELNILSHLPPGITVNSWLNLTTPGGEIEDLTLEKDSSIGKATNLESYSEFLLLYYISVEGDVEPHVP